VQTKEDALSRMADAVQAIPVMQDKKLIVASDLAIPSLSKDLLDALANTLKRANASDDTVCILYCRADELETDYKFETSPLYKKLSPVAKLVRFDLQPRGKLLAWTKRHFSKETIIITDEAAGTLVDLCAGRMTSLSFEIEKLICYAKYVKGGEPPRIEYEDVMKIAVPSAQDEVPFAMLNAAQSWKLTEILAVLNTAREQREEPVAVLARLSRIYLDMLMIKTASEATLSAADIAKIMKMKDFRITKYLSSIAKVPLSVIENAVQLSYETDRAMKSTPQDPWILLDKLAVSIYAPKSLRASTTITTSPKI
jgi:DNA polymerase-3 subunit delta